MKPGTRFRTGLAGLVLVWGHAMQAQDAKQIVQEAVNTELAAARNDNSHWRYLKHEPGGNEWVVVETENGTISRHGEENGKPPSAATIEADNTAIQRFIHDPSLQAKQRRDGAHDDKSAAELLNLLPQAFMWKVEGEDQEAIALSFRPDPDFHPPDMESRVMGSMTGSLVVTKKDHRIQTMKGRLEADVTIGFGLLARLKQGSTFDVERRQVAPGYWEITQTHVHIDGRALFFKTIGQQEDEVKTDFSLVPLRTTLEQAVGMLNQPER